MAMKKKVGCLCSGQRKETHDGADGKEEGEMKLTVREALRRNRHSAAATRTTRSCCEGTTDISAYSLVAVKLCVFIVILAHGG